MVDAVGSIAKIVGVALKIKEAVNTVHQNKKDCHHIRSRVDILNRTLSHHENNADLMEDPAVMAALEALDGILAEALEVITKCQEERNIVCVHCAAGKLSRRLSKVEQRISYLSSDAMFTIMNYQLLLKYQERAAPHPPPQTRRTRKIRLEHHGGRNKIKMQPTGKIGLRHHRFPSLENGTSRTRPRQRATTWFLTRSGKNVSQGRLLLRVHRLSLVLVVR